MSTVSERQAIEHASYDEYLNKHLLRIQLLLPLTLLLFIASALLCSFLPSPTLPEINSQYLTILTPYAPIIGVYWAVLLLLLIGTCLLLAIARSVETKRALVYGVGVRGPAVLLLMAVWAPLWTERWFVASEIVLLVTGVIALSIWGILLRYPPASRPMDHLFLLAPFKMLLVILMTLDIPQSGLLALSWYRYVGPRADHPHGKWEGEHQVHSWIVMGVLLGVALVNAGIVFAGTDVVWAVSALAIYISLCLSPSQKPPQVLVTSVLSAVLVGAALIGSVAWRVVKSRKEKIRLEGPEGERLPPVQGAVEA